MNILKNKANCIFLISMLFNCSAVAVHADTGKRLLFVGDPIIFDDNYWSGVNNLPAMEQSGSINVKPRVSFEKFTLEVLVGIVGNVALGYVGGCLGYYLSAREGKDSLNVIGGAIIGFSAGSGVGSSLGVYLVGNMGNIRGQFSKALLGSLLGEIVSLGVMLLSQDGTIGLLSLAILPPIGATILFNGSLRYRSLPEGNGLLNLSEGRLGLGIPDIHVRPLPFYGKNMKTEFQFKINMLSVVL